MQHIITLRVGVHRNHGVPRDVVAVEVYPALTLRSGVAFSNLGAHQDTATRDQAVQTPMVCGTASSTY